MSDQTQTTPATPVSSPTPGATATKRYIVVGEDDKFYARIYQVKLTKDGYDVDVVKNGIEVLEKVRARKPDLIMLDLMMPIKDGFDTLRELKEDPTLKDVPVIVSSNLGQVEDIEQTKTMGAVDYFIKTNVSIQEMIEKVKKFLQK